MAFVFFFDGDSVDEAFETTEGAEDAVEALDGGIDVEDVDKDANPLETLDKAVDGGIADEAMEAVSSTLLPPMLGVSMLNAV